jgi:hypothetical protein
MFIITVILCAAEEDLDIQITYGIVFIGIMLYSAIIATGNWYYSKVNQHSFQIIILY